MDKPNRTTLNYTPAVVIALAFAARTITECGAAPTSDPLFGRLILQRVQAHSRGDVAGYRKLLADDFVHVDDSGNRRTVDEISRLVATGNRGRWEVDKFHARPMEDSLAVVDCYMTELVPFGPRQPRMPLHET